MTAHRRREVGNTAAAGADPFLEGQLGGERPRPGGCDAGTPVGAENRRVFAWSLPASSQPRGVYRGRFVVCGSASGIWSFIATAGVIWGVIRL